MMATECSLVGAQPGFHNSGSFKPNEPFLATLPNSLSISAVADEILGQHVELERLTRSGAEGQSGCSIYFAHKDQKTLAVVKTYPPECQNDLVDELLSYKELISRRDVPSAVRPLGVGRTSGENSGETVGVMVYELAPGKAVNTMIRELGWISKFRRITKAASVDKLRRHELEDFVLSHRNELPLDWNTHDRIYAQGSDAYLEALPAFVDLLFKQLLEDLRTAVRAVALALAKLHQAETGKWSSAGENIVNEIRAKVQDWVGEIQRSSNAEYEKAGIDSPELQELGHAVERAINDSRAAGTASLLHGDASPGNFFWDAERGITMIDYGRLHSSIDKWGQPVGPAELDASGFYERLRKYAGGFGVAESDISIVQHDFWDAYNMHGVPLCEGIVRLCRVRNQMSRTWSAVTRLNRAHDNCGEESTRLKEAVKFEWRRLQMILGIREIRKKQKVLVVSNISGPGQGGLPILNQELVNAIAVLGNVSVTLFMTILPDTNLDIVSTQHPLAKVVAIPCHEQCDSNEMLYYAAKVHQPDEFGLPSVDQIRDSIPKFDLIIGHSRYSGAAAVLIRDRWYPNAKLAIINHTSYLRKSDAAWIWYGETREQGYVEATRLAILDEKTFPKADLMVGVGPVLTAEAREREWVGQLSRPRATASGPRFHELIPGVQVANITTKERQRQPDDRFRVLLAGRADDPAKGVNDAIYAVMKVAKAGANITLDILGVDAAHLWEKQQEVNSLIGVDGLVRFHPFSNDPSMVRHFYRTTDLVIMPSTHEGFGMVFTEAAGLGIPALVTQDSGAAQFALDRNRIPAELGDTCVIMDEKAYGVAPCTTSDRVAMWASRIDEVRQNPDKALQHARALQNKLRAYSWRCTAEALLRSALEHPEDDTIQMADGTVSRSQRLRPDVVESLNRAAKTRNSTGLPDERLADEVLESLPQIAPALRALDRYVSVALGQDVELKEICETHLKGYSGAPVFFVYPINRQSAVQQVPGIPSAEHGSGLLAVVKLFTKGLDNGIGHELSSLEWLLRRSEGNIITPTPIAVCRTTWAGKLAGAITYEVARGTSLVQLMFKLGQTEPGEPRLHMLSMLKDGIRGAAGTLERLHTHKQVGQSSAGYLQWYYQKAPERAQKVMQGEEALRAAGIQVHRLPERVDELITLSQEEIRIRPVTAVVHGDAHPGQFFFDTATNRITMIDVSTLHCSLGEHGDARGAPERDVGHFIHMLHRTGEQVGLNNDEINECAEIFLKTYCQEGSMPLKVYTLRLLVVCSALSFLANAAGNPDTVNEAEVLRQHASLLEVMFCLGHV